MLRAIREDSKAGELIVSGDQIMQRETGLTHAKAPLQCRATTMSVPVGLGGAFRLGIGRRERFVSMPQTSDAAGDQAEAKDLISFLKAIPEGVSLLRRSWPHSPWGALHPMASSACGGPWDPERLPQLP